MLSKVKQYDNCCAKAVVPLHANHFETRDVMELLLEKNHFLDICSNCFGPVSPSQCTPSSTCWMDEANANPESAAAQALFNFLAPNGNLCRIMECVSPPSDANMALWRSDTNTGIGDGFLGPFVKTFDLPLSAVCSFSMQVLSESETDFSDLPRERAPPMLFIPFWTPPFVTREAAGTAIVHTSMPCFMLPYFIARMVFYLCNRAHHQGTTMLSKPKDGGSYFGAVGRKIDSALSTALGARNATRPSIQFPFFNRLMGAYLQHYLSKSVAKTLVSRQNCLKLRFGVNEVMGALAVHFPLYVWNEFHKQPEYEVNRSSLRDHCTIAQLVASLPYVRVVCAIVLPPRPRATAPAATSKSFEEVTACDAVAYRTALGTIRQLCLSLHYFHGCREEHFHELLKLWNVLLGAEDVGKMHTVEVQRFVVERFEVFSFILADILTMIHQSSFVSNSSAACFELLSAILAAFNAPDVRQVLATLSTAIDEDPHHAALRSVRSNLALNWIPSDDARQPLLMPVFGADMRSRARNACVALRKRAEDASRIAAGAAKVKLEVQTAMDAIGKVLAALETLFPGVNGAGEDADGAATRRTFLHHTPRRQRLSTGSAKLLTDDQRAMFLAGKAQCPPPQDAPDVYYGRPSRHVLASDEVPALVEITKVVDSVAAALIRRWRSRRSKRCDWGHALTIVDDGASCSTHQGSLALWGCSPCAQRFCATCIPPPIGRHGAPMRILRGRTTAACCSSCGVVIPANALALMDSGMVHCRLCAVDLRVTFSTRFLASYTSLWIIGIVAVFVVFFVLPRFRSASA